MALCFRLIPIFLGLCRLSLCVCFRLQHFTSACEHGCRDRRTSDHAADFSFAGRPLDPPDAPSDQAGVPLLDEDYLILSTIHSAKGQEWKSVYVLNVVDGCMPSDLGAGTSAEIEEERRLARDAADSNEDS